jgi:hypothetical protein
MRRLGALVCLASCLAGCAAGRPVPPGPGPEPAHGEAALAEARSLREQLKVPDDYLDSLRLGALEPEDPAVRCQKVCAAADQVCELAGRICGLADAHPAEAAIRELCQDAGPRCDHARETAWKACECGIPRPASVPPYSG